MRKKPHAKPDPIFHAPHKSVRDAILLACLTALVVSLTVAAYWPVLACGVTYLDDNEYWVQNHLVQHASWNSAGQFLSEVAAPSTVRGYYQPLTMISLMADWSRGARRDNLRPLHETNLALHAANAALVTLLLYALFGNVWVAAVLGLLFGVHPQTVECVAWVTERKTLLATFAALWALLLYVLYARRRRWGLYVAALAAFVLSLLAKPTTLPLPLLLLVLDYWPLRRLSRAAVVEKLPFVVVAGLSAIITFVSQAAAGNVILPREHTLLETPLTVCHNIVFYLANFIWPVRLAAFYPLPDTFSLSQPALLAGLAGTIVLIAGLIVSLRWTRALLAGWLFFFVAIFPTLGVIGFTNVIAANKYAYLPLLGFLLLLAVGLSRVWAGLGRAMRPVALALALVFVLSAAAISRRDLAYWRDNETFYRYMLNLAPHAAPLHNQLGLALAAQGRTADAAAQYEQALVADPHSAEAHGNLGTLYSRQGDAAQAEMHLREAIRLDPTSERGYVNLGNALARQNRYDEALASWRRALELNPYNAATYNNLGNGLRATGKMDEAIRYYREAIRLQPDHVDAHCNLTGALFATGATDEALTCVENTLRLSPTSADKICNLAAALLVQSEPTEASRVYEAVLRIDPQNARAIEGLRVVEQRRTATSQPAPP